ncbi:MAG: hypothetical protein J2P28_15275, partial [Actinobacteria bacterium]|nr:hypothetical protein [Actinomycetota bacterium]
RLALWVDDAHLLDKASAALVHRLAVDRSVSLLVTTRAGAPAPDPITALWKEGIASRLDLGGLSEAEVGRLLGAALGGYIDGKSLHLLTEAASGNVLYLHELVLSGMATGALSQASGIWRCSGPIAPGAALTELIEERLSGLVPAQRRLLEALALGEPLDAGLFQRLAPAPVLESVEDSGLVAAVDSAGTLRVRVAHPLYAEVLRKGIPRLRAKALLRELADGMEAVEGRRPEGILRSSVLRLESGDRIATDRAVAAAQWALQLGDYQLAENLIRSAETDAGFAGRLVLGDALIRQHREEEAEQLLGAVVPATDAEVARLAVVRASNLVHGLGRHEEAIALLVASESRVDARAREELLATRALFLSVGTSNGGGLQLANEVIARPGVTPTPLARSCAAAAYALAFAGRPDEALRLLEAHGLPAGGPRIGYVENVVMSARGTALMLSGRFEEARQFTIDRYRQALQEGQEAIRAYWAFMWGLDVPYTGDARAAMDRLLEAIAISRTADPQYVLASALATLAQAAAMCGDVRTAGEA